MTVDATQDPPSVCLQLDSRPECLPLVRGTLAGIAESLGLDSELLDDLKTAVSEACNNVVLHAYGGGVGPLIVGLEIRDGDIEIVVRDRGSGIQHVSASTDRIGVGLAVISSLADRAEFLSAPGGGTDVRMTFAGRAPDIEVPGRDPAGAGGDSSPQDSSPQDSSPQDSSPGDGPPVELSGDVVVWVAPPSLLDGVLGRLTRALAAAARFSLDRFSDVYMVTDALVAYAQSAARAGRVTFAIVAGESRLELRIGPFAPRSGSELSGASSPRLPSPLALLADELTVEPAGSSELLRLVLVDRRGGTVDRAD